MNPVFSDIPLLLVAKQAIQSPAGAVASAIVFAALLVLLVKVRNVSFCCDTDTVPLHLGHRAMLILGSDGKIVDEQYAYSTDVPHIQGIPEMPGALPFIGHLHLHAGASGRNDAAVWADWSKKLGSDLLQVRFGNRRVVVANSFASIKEIFVTNGSQSSARPRQYVFEKYVGYDLGSHSLDDNYRSQRMAALKSIKASAWPSFYECLEREGDLLIANLAEQGQYGDRAVRPLAYMQVVAMALAWAITFDKRFVPNDPWLREYIDNACLITKVRGASNTWSDFVPILRLHPRFVAMGRAGRRASQRRTAMVQKVLEDLEQRIAAGEPTPPCVAAQVLVDTTNKLSLWNAIKCSTSMLQGGTESIPSHLTAGMGGLTQNGGPAMQEKAYAAIRDAYPDGDTEAIAHAFREEAVPYVAALYKEILRNYVVLPMSLPHAADQDIHLSSGITIPKGTTLYMNSEAGNHDEAVFGQTAHNFDPERWLRDPGLERRLGTVPHASYGIGSRICPAWQISNRIMYGLLVRIILAFRMEADPDHPPPKDYTCFGCTPDLVLNSPKAFPLRFVPRDRDALRKQVAKIRERYQ